MSLLMLAVEYLILHTIFETIRSNDEKSIEHNRVSEKILGKWTPLTDIEIENIKKSTG